MRKLIYFVSALVAMTVINGCAGCHVSDLAREREMKAACPNCVIKIDHTGQNDIYLMIDTSNDAVRVRRVTFYMNSDKIQQIQDL